MEVANKKMVLEPIYFAECGNAYSCSLTNTIISFNLPDRQPNGAAYKREMVSWKAWLWAGRSADRWEAPVRLLRRERSSWRLLPGPGEWNLCRRLHTFFLVNTAVGIFSDFPILWKCLEIAQSEYWPAEYNFYNIKGAVFTWTEYS